METLPDNVMPFSAPDAVLGPAGTKLDVFVARPKSIDRGDGLIESAITRPKALAGGLIINLGPTGPPVNRSGLPARDER
jgi:hypothetical protein